MMNKIPEGTVPFVPNPKRKGPVLHWPKDYVSSRKAREIQEKLDIKKLKSVAGKTV